MTSSDEILRFNFVFVDGMRSFQVAAEKNSGKLLIRCSGFFGQEDVYPDYKWDFIMDEGAWDKLMIIIEDAGARNWNPSYRGQSANEDQGWSLEIHMLGKHTLSEGSNKYPKTYDQFFQDMLSFVKMKRKQLKISSDDLRFITVASHSGEECPIVMVDRTENTFTLYNLLEDPNEEGAFFMKEGDWDELTDILQKNNIFHELSKSPSSADPELCSEYSVTLAYKPGQIVQRYSGKQPEWWPAFNKEFIDKIVEMLRSDRKRADRNILERKKDRSAFADL